MAQKGQKFMLLFLHFQVSQLKILITFSITVMDRTVIESKSVSFNTIMTMWIKTKEVKD